MMKCLSIPLSAIAIIIYLVPFTISMMPPAEYSLDVQFFYSPQASSEVNVTYSITLAGDKLKYSEFSQIFGDNKLNLFVVGDDLKVFGDFMVEDQVVDADVFNLKMTFPKGGNYVFGVVFKRDMGGEKGMDTTTVLSDPFTVDGEPLMDPLVKNTQMMKTVNAYPLSHHGVLDLSEILIEENGGHDMSHDHDHDDDNQMVHISFSKQQEYHTDECSKFEFELFKGANHDHPAKLFPIDGEVSKFMVVQGNNLSSLQVKYGSIPTVEVDDHHDHDHMRQLMDHHDSDMVDGSNSNCESAVKINNTAVTTEGFGHKITTYANLNTAGYYTIIGQANFNMTHYVTFNYGFEVEEKGKDNGDDDSTASSDGSLSFTLLCIMLFSIVLPITGIF